MAVPTYGGSPIFGANVVMVTTANPRASMVQSLFGSDGLVPVDGGSRGLRTYARGVVSGSGPYGLTSAFALAGFLRDNNTRTLVDVLGEVWQQVILERFDPVGVVRQSPDGIWFRGYLAVLLHLV
jgi:hypothetical protein